MIYPTFKEICGDKYKLEVYRVEGSNVRDYGGEGKKFFFKKATSCK